MFPFPPSSPNPSFYREEEEKGELEYRPSCLDGRMWPSLTLDGYAADSLH